MLVKLNDIFIPNEGGIEIFDCPKTVCCNIRATDKWPQLSRFTHELSLDMLYFIVNVGNDLFYLLIG